MPTVTIVDYGKGNLLSVRRAFEYFNAEVDITDSFARIDTAERLVLQGVGAFADEMAGLHKRGFTERIRNYAKSGRPLLGICLGMQMLMEESHEFGRHEGLGLIPGEVKTIPKTGVDGKPHKIPHIGWNSLALPPTLPGWEGTILQGITPGSACYFIHSYSVVSEKDQHRLANTFYNGQRISAAVYRDTIFGTQFHPEKSGEVGLRIIRCFLRYQP
ncbi:MAG: imidazole glycerol phosphate synthase subunit HisH [Geobacteraceae bacterium]|nr:imidazole glycerol phosphate synthase subunit HisH [Geobacteraceae bacterium]